MRIRVSDLDQWVRFVEPEIPQFEVSTEDFLAYLRRDGVATDKMRAGSAFHSVMEEAREGDDIEEVTVDGFDFSFAFDLPAVHAPLYREELVERVYGTPHGPVLLRGRVDGREGIEVCDYKLSFGGFDAERYAKSLQWKAYLDMTGAKRFRYVVFQAKLKGSDVWVYDSHELIQWAYAGMSDDVGRRVAEVAAFVHEHVPELIEEGGCLAA